MRTRLSRQDRDGTREVLAEWEGPFVLKVAIEKIPPDAPLGHVFQSFSADEGKTWTEGFVFEWDGMRLWPLACRKKLGNGLLCTGISGHRGKCS